MRCLIFLFVFVLLGACSKTEREEVPPPTRTGNYTIAFRTEYGVYKAEGSLPSGGSRVPVTYALGYIRPDSSIHIRGAAPYAPMKFSLGITCPGFKTGNNHYDLAAQGAGVIFYRMLDDERYEMYTLDTVRGGRLDITYRDSKVLAGTFDIHLVPFGIHVVHFNGVRKLHITEGWFDTR